jgi:hypothetical protein
MTYAYFCVKWLIKTFFFFNLTNHFSRRSSMISLSKPFYYFIKKIYFNIFLFIFVKNHLHRHNPFAGSINRKFHNHQESNDQLLYERNIVDVRNKTSQKGGRITNQTIFYHPQPIITRNQTIKTISLIRWKSHLMWEEISQ